jgi:hypothetical protein
LNFTNLYIRYVFLADDNKLQAKNTEPQLGGEMLAVALCNFDLPKKTEEDEDRGVAQTIFGMYVKGNINWSLFRGN